MIGIVLSFSLAVITLVLPAGPALADGLLPCERVKLRAAGALTRCQLAVIAKSGDLATESDFQRCDETLARLFARAEERSGGECPASGDAAQVASDVREMTDSLVARLSGDEPCGAGQHEVCECRAEENPCNLVDCHPHQQCLVYEETGEAYCADTCGGYPCPSGQHCELQEVTCVRAPCPPVAACVENGPVCSLPPETGDCDAAIQRWYFNAASGKCEEFIYGGCGGNGNNFQSKPECEAACPID